jgi:hypothetical protein
MFQNGGWPEAEYYDEPNDETSASNRFNRQSLIALLKTTGEDSVELYGIWAGNYLKEPAIRETISVDQIADPQFLFKEYCFYNVLCI